MTKRTPLWTPNSISRRSALVGGAGLLGLGLAACGSDGGDGGSGGDGPEGKTITLGYIASWTDGLSTAYLLDNRLTAMGYTVEHETIADAALLYAGLAQGDVNMYPSAWPEVTHADYMDKYGDNIEDLVAYYEGAKLNFSVPDYMDDITSIADLQGQADRFGGKIYGIEPGAGITDAAKNKVIPGYGLDGYELVTSSTPAMLTELQNAIDAQEDIVVTLWSPFWAMTAFPVRALEDPDGHFGEPEALHHLAHKGFSEENPMAAEWISQATMTAEQFGSLEDMVVNEFGEGKEAEAVEKWLEENPDAMPPLPEQ